MSVKIITCNCKSEYQDKLYGQNRRVANETKHISKKGGKEFRCTVCTKSQ